MKTSLLLNLFATAFAGLGLNAQAYESAYPRTEPGTTELKQIPAQTVMEAEAPGGYYEKGGSAFMKLFRYIQRNDVAMTVPVEADIPHNRMRFFVGPAHADRTLASDAEVRVVELPARTVVSAGLRGGYSKENFDDGLATVRAWLKANPEWAATGEPYGVFWHSPFVPGLFKKSEVHLPVAKTPPK